MSRMQVRQHDAPKLGAVRARQAQAARRSKRRQLHDVEARKEARRRIDRPSGWQRRGVQQTWVGRERRRRGDPLAAPTSRAPPSCWFRRARPRFSTWRWCPAGIAPCTPQAKPTLSAPLGRCWRRCRPQAASPPPCLPACHPDSLAFAAPSTMPPRHTLSPLSACAPHTSLRKVDGTGGACGSWSSSKISNRE